MKKVFASLITITVFTLALPLVRTQGQGQKTVGKFLRSASAVPNRYIVVLNDDALVPDVSSIASSLANAHQGSIEHTYSHAIKGFATRMSEAEAMALSQNPLVKYVEEEGVMSLSTTQQNATYALDRIDQRCCYNTTYQYSPTGAGVNVYVLDTGIRITHTEFGGRASVEFDGVDDDGNPLTPTIIDRFGQDGIDLDGHGTHVAASIGGSRFGVAKGVRLFSVRVFGVGRDAEVMAGIDWVTAHHVKPAVANMSFEGPPSNAIDDAVRNCIAAGVTVVVAAGNGDRFHNPIDASGVSPAHVREAITVGATDINDARADFSNFGPLVDIFAPGVDIISAGIGNDNDIMLMSGTSQATPHVAGVAALYLQLNPGPPALVQQEIISKATGGRVQNPGPGSPNRLLFSGLGSVYFADVDGDRMADAIVVNDGHITVRRSNGSSFGPNESWTSNPYFGDRGTFFADVTGDGRADAIVVNDDHITVRRSNGSSFGQNEPWTDGPYYGGRGTLFVSVTSNNAAEAIVVNDSGITVRRSNGLSFQTNEPWTNNPYYGTR